MIDILRFLLPNASVDDLITTSNAFVLFGWFIVFFGVLGLFMESIGQRRLFYEAFPLILFGLFMIEPLGMHSNISLTNFFEVIPIIINPIV